MRTSPRTTLAYGQIRVQGIQIQDGGLQELGGRWKTQEYSEKGYWQKLADFGRTAGLDEVEKRCGSILRPSVLIP
ncbi:MAG: hypothetical protein LPD71_14705 [Shewanella sp.]|nr:hypothetical protein [Shewanella sp.]MCF1455995.1 hypothetical protein [Shewanella sp.]